MGRDSRRLDAGAAAAGGCRDAPRVVHGARGDGDRERGESRGAGPARGGAGGVAAGRDASRPWGTAGAGVRLGHRGGRAVASGRLRRPEPLRARRDGHHPRHLGDHPRRPPQRRTVEAWGEEPQHGRRRDGCFSSDRELCRCLGPDRCRRPQGRCPHGRRDADHRRRPPVGHGRCRLEDGQTLAGGRRGAARVVHGAVGDGDRQCREPRRAQPGSRRSRRRCGGSRRWSLAACRPRRCSRRSPRRSCGCSRSISLIWAATNPTQWSPSSPPRAARPRTFPSAAGGALGERTSPRSCSRPGVLAGSTTMATRTACSVSPVVSWACAHRPERRSSSRARCGASSSLVRPRASRCRRTSRDASDRLRSWWRRPWRTPRVEPLWLLREHGSSPPRMRAGGGSSVICMTARSSGWCTR